MRATSNDDFAAFVPDRLGRVFRDDADFGQRVAGIGLDLEPDAKARLRLPDGGHFGAGIARDHVSGSRAEGLLGLACRGGRSKIRHNNNRSRVAVRKC